MRIHARLALALALAWASLPGFGQPVQTPAAPRQEPPAASPPAPAASAATPPPAQSALTAPLLYELLLGEIAFDTGQQEQGTAFILDAAQSTGDEALFQRATEMAIRSRSGPAALQAVRAWRTAHPKSPGAMRFELQVLMGLGRMADTAQPVQALLEVLPESEKLGLITALPALYQRAPDRPLVTRTLESALAPALKNPALAAPAWTSIGRARLQEGNRAGALAAATLGMDADPASPWPARLALQLFPSEPAAEPIIRRHLANPGSDADDRFDFARALLVAGRSADALQQLDALLERQPDNAQAWGLRGLVLAELRQNGPAEQSLQRCLSLLEAQGAVPDNARPLRDRVYMTLAAIAERRNDFAGAQQWLARVQTPEQSLNARIQGAGILARQGQLEQARELIRSAPEREPKDALRKTQAEAQLLREHGDAAGAWQLLSQAMAKHPDDELLMYDAAMVAERLDRMDETERLLRRVIALKPDTAQAYNALGYALADRDLRLPEARQLIQKALELAPGDAYIQDSLGWVEFRMGNLQEARRLLQGAWSKRPDAEIAAHLGEVLWMLGERDGARKMWQDGLRLDAKNETLVKTIERLQAKP